MQKNEIGHLLSDLWSDLQQPDMLWQVATLGFCLGLAWLAARALRREPTVIEGAWRTGHRGLNRILFPLFALGLVLLARLVLRQWHHVNLLNVALPLLGSFAVIRAVMFALRQAFAPSGWLAAFERMLALTVWSVVALHILGLLPELIGALESVGFSVGKQRLSLWLLLQGVVTVLVTLLLALWGGGLIEARLLKADSIDGNLRLVFARLSKALLILLAVLISLPLVGIDLTALSVFGGALGVGIGFGLQKIASNYVSGFIILLDRSIRLGNVISVDKVSGEVTQITTRYTVLRGNNGVEAIVPNDVLIGSVVQNETYTNPRVRLALTVQVGYAGDPERAMALLVEAARRHPRVLAEPAPKAYLVRFADSGIELELGFWIADPQEGSLNIKSDIGVDIWRAFRQEGIEIPYPRQEVRVLNASELPRS
ncbi:MAG: mechanosensitive ion channel [Rhodocyclales bacterium]|nr:mechanosensitive ion channel [Rhodocyclales bacterium]